MANEHRSENLVHKQGKDICRARMDCRMLPQFFSVIWLVKSKTVFKILTFIDSVDYKQMINKEREFFKKKQMPLTKG